MADFEDQVELPAEGLELTEETISFNDNGTVNDDVYVQEVAAPELSAVVVDDTPELSAVVVEEEEVVPVQTVVTEEVQEEIPAPVAVVEEPEPTYVAPIEEPVHHVRWPWALLALPLLAIPFIPRHTEPVAEPVRVVETPVVVDRPTTPAARAVTPTTPVPTCDGTWTTTGKAVLRETAKDTGTEVQTLASGTAIDITAAESGWYKVKVGNSSGYLPVNVVVCTAASAPAQAPAPAVAPAPAATTTVTG